MSKAKQKPIDTTLENCLQTNEEYANANKRLAELEKELKELSMALSFNAVKTFNASDDLAERIRQGEKIPDEKILINKKKQGRKRELLLQKAVEKQKNYLRGLIQQIQRESSFQYDEIMETFFNSVIDTGEAFFNALSELKNFHLQIERQAGIPREAWPAHWKAEGLFSDLGMNRNDGKGNFPRYLAIMKQNWRAENSPLLPAKVTPGTTRRDLRAQKAAARKKAS